MPRFFKACLRGESPLIYGDGEQSGNSTLVANAVQADLLVTSALVSACREEYNVARGRSVAVNDLTIAVLEIVGGGQPVRHGPPREGDVRFPRADLTRAWAKLGCEAAMELAVGCPASPDCYRETLCGTQRFPPAGASRS